MGGNPCFGFELTKKICERDYNLQEQIHFFLLFRSLHRGSLDRMNKMKGGKFSVVMFVELNDLYCSPNIVRVIKSRRMRWAGHVARMG